ncbi:MAG: hypothetical protein B7Y43_15350 [Sphingomonas sp. 28-62-20]|uniref:sensor histidine kinase n=1 Tax=Sphingomonas sp. 28-62-20 TaxID=1970433 RepID=UPI000BC6782D|nr:MAG: hypothetical protein B7Y43_15350 [Sphingomonas sp. 28-62-20]
MDALVAFVRMSSVRAAGRAFALLLPLAILLGAPHAGAQSARDAVVQAALPQFKHTRWTADEGAPLAITQIAQTPDGWLWLTTFNGLQRFDGVTFETVAPPAGSPLEHYLASGLYVSRSGELWVGFSNNGGVAVYRNGRLQDTRMPSPGAAVTGFAETPDGAIWAASQEGMRRYFGGRWQDVSRQMGVPQGSVTSMKVGADGTFWIAITKGAGRLARLRPGASRFEALSYEVGPRAGLTEDRHGRLWVADKFGTRIAADRNGQLLPAQVLYPPIAGLSRAKPTFDDSGALWSTTSSSGIFYIRNAAEAAGGKNSEVVRYGLSDGLTSNISHGSLRDREGNIWITTDEGLDQFRIASALVEPALSGGTYSNIWMARAADKSIYISSSAGVFHIASGQAPRRILDYHLDGLCAAYDEGIWAVNATDLLRYSRGRWSRVQALLREKRTGDCTEDRHGRLWLTMPDGTLSWRDANGWQVAGPQIRKSLWWEIITTPAGDVAFKTKDEFVQIRGNRQFVTKLAAQDRGDYAMVAPGLADVFIGTATGLLRVRDGKFARIDKGRVPWLARVRWLVQTSGGQTWLLRRDGVSRVVTADLDRAFDDPRAPLQRVFFGRQDGAGTTQNQGITGPQAAIDDTGRYWFLTYGSVSFIDLARLRRNALPPPIVIRSLVSNGQTFRDPVRIVLRPGTRSLDIAFTALSLTVPRRVQFRVRLEGVDDDWVDPGTRRTASYSNLGPGSYRFHVIAANNDGVWNSKGATLDFEIRPTFFEGWPFRLLLGAALAVVIWLAYSMRLRRVANRIRSRMAERMEERERIARDLHDTLLQSVQALTLRFQLVVDELPVDERARPALEAAIDRADEVVAEGRDRVKDLRLPNEAGDIAQIMTEIVAQQGFDPAVAVSIETVGIARSLDPLALDEIVRIAGEAVFNVRRHARATRIAIEIRFQSGFAICIVDDGVGIAPAIIEQGGKDGHFGLPGMRERARKLDGDLLIRRIPEGGTQVVLTVPGRIAYQKRVWRWPSRWWWWA